MTTAFAIQVILSVLAVLFVSYGLLHEDKFVAFEDMIIRYIRKRIYLRKRRKALEKRRQQGRYNNSSAPAYCQSQERRQGASAERRRVA